MPFITSTPYMQAEEILQFARSISNDAAQSLAGDILSDAQPYTFVLLEGAYESLQDSLIDAGVNTYSEYQTVTGLTAAATTDPGVMMALGYTGYYDGAANHGTPALPADLIMPLEIWERQSLTQNNWAKMTQAADSISSRSQSGNFGIWDFEFDTLYLPGATLSNDLKFKYLRYAPELTTAVSPVLIARCKPALANLFVAAACRARGGLESAASFETTAKAEIAKIINRTAAKEQYASFTRKPFRNRGRRRY